MYKASKTERAAEQGETFAPAQIQQQAIAGTRTDICSPSRKPTFALLFLSIAAVLGTAISNPIHAQTTDPTSDDPQTSTPPDIRPATSEEQKVLDELEAKRLIRDLPSEDLDPDGEASGKGSTGLGFFSSADGTYATAVGNSAKASADESSAYGMDSEAIGVGSTAIGASSKAIGSYSTTIGTSAQATGAFSLAVGNAKMASGYHSIAIGEASQALNDNSIASGVFSKASGVKSSAYGYFSKAEGDYSTASGDHSSASGAKSTAIGSQAIASASNSVALGQGSIADQNNTVSVGSAQNQRRVTNVAAGTQGTDAVNVNQLNGDIGKMQNQFNSSINKMQNWTKSYVDQQTLGVSRAAYSGIAGATALTMIPDVESGKTFAVGVGAGQYKGYSAGAVGISARVSDNIKLKAGLGFSGNGNTGGVGASYQW